MPCPRSTGREYAEVGGLITYGADITEAYRQAGSYAGRILSGAKADEMPVVQLTKLELIVNPKTAGARTHGPAVTATRADEVIE